MILLARPNVSKFTITALGKASGPFHGPLDHCYYSDIHHHHPTTLPILIRHPSHEFNFGLTSK